MCLANFSYNPWSQNLAVYFCFKNPGRIGTVLTQLQENIVRKLPKQMPCGT